MPEIWPKIGQGMGIQIEKMGLNVAGEVHNAAGNFVVGTFCLLTHTPTQLQCKPKVQ